MRRFIRVALSALVLVGVVAQQASAHPIHTTLTQVAIESNAITLNVRAFADDFSASVARLAGRKAPADSSAPDADVLAYMRAQFAVLDVKGASVVLQPCGIRRARELYWVCVRAEFPAGPKGARIRNQMLTELHADQVNIVQVNGASARRTLLFTRGSAPSAVGI